MALTSLGPEELDEPELPLPVLPEAPPPKMPPLPNGLPELPERPEEFEPPDDPEPAGKRELPDVGLKACVVPPLLVVAWPMPKPAPRTASAAAPARRPLRTRWLLLPVPGPEGCGAVHTGSPGFVGGGPPSDEAVGAASIGLPARAPMA